MPQDNNFTRRVSSVSGALRFLPRQRMGISFVIFKIIQADKSILDRWLDWTSRSWWRRWYVAWRVLTVSERFGGILGGLGFKGEEVSLITKRISGVFSDFELAKEVSANLVLIQAALKQELAQDRLELRSLQSDRAAAIDYILLLPLVEAESRSLGKSIRESEWLIAEAQEMLLAVTGIVHQINGVGGYDQGPFDIASTEEHRVAEQSIDGFEPRLVPVGKRGRERTA